jgi:hypothetical protein
MINVELEEKQTQLLNKVMGLSLMMEGIWKYHPNNPDRKDVTEAYDDLLAEQKLVLNELDKIV